MKAICVFGSSVLLSCGLVWADETSSPVQAKTAVCETQSTAVSEAQDASNSDIPAWIAGGGFKIVPGQRVDLPPCPAVFTTCTEVCLNEGGPPDPCRGVNCVTTDTGNAACQTGTLQITCSGGQTIHVTTCAKCKCLVVGDICNTTGSQVAFCQ